MSQSSQDSLIFKPYNPTICNYGQLLQLREKTVNFCLQNYRAIVCETVKKTSKNFKYFNITDMYQIKWQNFNTPFFLGNWEKH